jgi:hypothetical protein
LGCSDAEWKVIGPRVEAVYNLVHPLPQGRDGASSGSDVNQRKQELREVLDDKWTAVDQIKATLTVLRAAEERANQKLAAAQKSLRELLTVRQEATLVLNSLLD